MKKVLKNSSIFIIYIIPWSLCFGQMFNESFMDDVTQSEFNQDLSINKNFENYSTINNFEIQSPFYDFKRQPAMERAKHFELDMWYGFTFSEIEDKNGLRRVDFKYLPNERNLIFVYYDNALVIDNAIFATQERFAPIFAVGAKHDWSKQWFTKLDAGRRFMETQEDQHIINMENGYFFSDKLLGKVITQYDFREANDLITLAGLVEYKVFDNLRLELGFFHSDVIDVSNTYNERILFTPKTTFFNMELITGIYYDILKMPDVQSNRLGGVFGIWTFPVMYNLKGKLFFNHDKGFNNEINIVSVGLNHKF